MLALTSMLALALFLTLAPVQPAQAQSKSSAAKGVQEPTAAAAIRKNLAARLPQMPAIDEVRALPLTGGTSLYEVRVGQDIFYTDAQGRHLIQGQIIDLESKRNLTEERTEQLTAVRFQDLPFDDAFIIRRGKGERQLAVFSDPECGYCRRLERELAGIDNVTIHVFLYPVLGPQSTEKSQAVWCTAPAQRAQVWLDWMLKGTPPAAQANCPQRNLDALARNLEFGRKHRIQGTPTLFFANDARAPGALSARQIEQQFANAAASK
ncbi:disulfide isomerase [Hylemonella gracilis str. Niagara R]|uniref:Thiol:disulfide interchange protein n=2 Tax=Hylemonella gracilis TaxID=80880 RepID=A0A016XG81_9BURK|nr:disulfide isomerase [Hylemonella gracilis str. Niagara R]